MTRREFRSDTMTLPTAAMRQAMRDAEVGDDVCEEDPTVTRLERLAAERLGKQAALFVPSGTFGNQCAIGVHTQPGDEVILAETVHVVEHEGGAPGMLWGVQLRTVQPTHARYLCAAEVAVRLRTTGDFHEPRTGLVLIENALSDGTVMPVAAMREIKDIASAQGVPVHLDGARIFNAALTLGVAPLAIAGQADSVMFCLSKGLGAPVGSMLAGSTEFIRQARRRRKMMGGGMRQVGVLAAPGLLALEDGPARLATDHAHAALLGRLLAAIPGVSLDTGTVQTNMVYCRIEKPGYSDEGLVTFLAERGIDTYAPLRIGVRFVTSSRIGEADVRALAEAVSAYLA